jgi:4-amino-4-deoxy-L-arabinose transferase-like glycosyltransferase
MRRTEPESGRGAVAFWAVATALLLVGLGSPSFRGSEDRFAEITREMIASGDYFHPTLNGEPHFHKPLLAYWAITLASRATGALGELSARLPSALAGLLALAATVSLGRRLFGPVVGRVAGWMLLSTYGFLLWSRTAAADMENLAAVILAVAWFRAREDRPGPLLYLVFAIVCAVGAGAKGLAAIVLPVLVLAPHLLRHRRFLDHARPRALLVAIAAGALVYLAPLVWADASREGALFLERAASGDTRSGLYMVFQENVRRFYAPHDHRGPPYTYLVALPVLLLPWTAVFLASLSEAVRNRARIDPEVRWLLWSIALVFAFFTASGSRRSYYVLPILPFCVLLVANSLAGEGRSRLADVALRWTGLALAACGGASVVAAFVAPVAGWFGGVTVPPALTAATLALGAGTVALWRRRERLARVADAFGLPPNALAPIALAAVLLGGYFAVQGTLLDRFRTEKPFALSLARATAGLPEGRIAFLLHVPPLFPFYTDASAPIRVLHEASEVRAFAAAGPGAIVASPRSIARLPGGEVDLFARPPDLREELYPWNPGDQRLGAWWVGGAIPATGVRPPAERGDTSWPSSSEPTT